VEPDVRPVQLWPRLHPRRHHLGRGRAAAGLQHRAVAEGACDAMTATTQVTEAPVVKPGGVKEVRRAFSGRTASILIVLLTILWTVPTFGVFITSFRPAHDVANSGWWEFFVHPHLTWDNYHTVLFVGGSGVTGGIIPYLVNSLVITIPATLISLTIAAMAAYCLAWIRFRGSDTIFFIIFALQVVPLQMSLVPLQRFYNLGAHIGSVP